MSVNAKLFPNLKNWNLRSDGRYNQPVFRRLTTYRQPNKLADDKTVFKFARELFYKALLLFENANAETLTVPS